MRKGLIILFLLLIIAFGVIGFLQNQSSFDVQLEEHGLELYINS